MKGKLMLNTLFANDVRQTLDHFRRSVDQMFESFDGNQGASSPARGSVSDRNWTFSPVLESAWTDSLLNIRAILPGVSDKDVNVTVQNNQLVIEGERKLPQGFSDNKAWTQLAYGRFYTAVTLPSGLDVDHVNCRLENGILDIQIPLSEASKPRQIRIQIGETHKAIGA
jgi:HSP20 family protein